MVKFQLLEKSIYLEYLIKHLKITLSDQWLDLCQFLFCLNRIHAEVLMLLWCKLCFFLHFVQIHNLIIRSLEMVFDSGYNFSNLFKHFLVRLKWQFDVFLENFNKTNVATEVRWDLVFLSFDFSIEEIFSSNINSLKYGIRQMVQLVFTNQLFYVS